MSEPSHERYRNEIERFPDSSSVIDSPFDFLSDGIEPELENTVLVLYWNARIVIGYFPVSFTGVVTVRLVEIAIPQNGEYSVPEFLIGQLGQSIGCFLGRVV